MSRTQQLAAIVAGIGAYMLVEHFHLISSSYSSGRIEAKAAFLFGAAIVLLVWTFVRQKKRDPDAP